MSGNDTTEEAKQVLADIYRRMPAKVKGRHIFEAYQMGRLLAIAGLKQLNPNASKKKLWYLWARKHLGQELFQKAYGELSDERT